VRATEAPTNVVPGDTSWITGDAGLSLRRINVYRVAGQKATPLVVVRVDPAKVRLRVAYTPDRPRGLGRWFAEEQPLAAINGGFFTSEYRTTALIISDGIAKGSSYEGFGGMLAVARDGSIWLQPLHDQPYDASKPIVQAMQSFPMLVFPGGAPTSFDDNGQRARRTAVAIDRAGRLLLIVSPTSDLTLHELADWLRQSDLEIERALNLDGGPSTGLYLNDGAASEQIDSLGPLPIVLLVEPK
jgi:uncharacterized protein YigE (DUF2233 family)